MNKKSDDNCLTLQDYYQNSCRLRLVDVSAFLDIYMAASFIVFAPLFFNILPMGVPTVTPVEFFFNICFPIGTLAFLWCTKLALQTREWRMLSFDLIKLVFPPLFAILCCWFMNMEVSPHSIWWLGFLPK
jgi:hypothetical protein